MIEFIGAISEDDLAKADKDTIAMIKSQALVRCKDCYHLLKDGTMYWCSRLHSTCFRVELTDYCSKVERRTDEPD